MLSGVVNGLALPRHRRLCAVLRRLGIRACGDWGVRRNGVFRQPAIAAVFAVALQLAFRNTPTPFYARDPAAFGPVPILLVIGATIAMLKPALRACAANPASSLRQD
jgi:hypothetical protein